MFRLQGIPRQTAVRKPVGHCHLGEVSITALGVQAAFWIALALLLHKVGKGSLWRLGTALTAVTACAGLLYGLIAC